MKYSEIFYSIQGEGMNTGVPSVFLRTAYCNLNCLFCDSKFSLYHNDDIMTDDTKEIAKKLLSYKCSNIVITGGEPMLQKTELQNLIKNLRSLNSKVHITIETNGTIFDENIKPDLWSISPKTTNSFKLSGEDYQNPILVKNMKIHFRNNTYQFLSNFLKSSIKCQYKFVISDVYDINEIKYIIQKYKIPRELVWLMPEGVTIKDQRKKSLFVVDICKKEGFNFCTRLHIYLWGNKRGV